jgi:hypothetical protein
MSCAIKYAISPVKQTKKRPTIHNAEVERINGFHADATQHGMIS